MNLTPKQLQILRFIRDYRVRHGCSPTLREMGEEFNIAKPTLFEHVEALVRKGALTRDPNKARSLRILDDSVLPDEEPASSTTRIPLAGRIAAGYPIEKVADDEQLDLEQFFGPRRGQSGSTFALRVEGDSMRDEGIWDGDFVIVERRDTARNGDRVVALLPNGESTLKTYFREANRIRLQPANPEFEPIYVTDCRIQGIVIGVLRSYR